MRPTIAEAVAAAFGAVMEPVWCRAPAPAGDPEAVEAALTSLDEVARAGGLVVLPAGPGPGHRVWATPAAIEPVAPAVLLVTHVDAPTAPDERPPAPDAGGDAVVGHPAIVPALGVGVALLALRALRDGCPERWPHLAIRVVAGADGADGGTSAREVIERLVPHARAALGLDPARAPELPTTAADGGAWLRAVAHGRSAHAGNNHADGVNAICALSLWLPRLREAACGGPDATLHVGRAGGGTSKNTVPERAWADLWLRYGADGPGGDALARIREAARAPVPDVDDPTVAARVAGARLELLGASIPAWDATPECDELLSRVAPSLGVQARTGARSPRATLTNHLGAAGVPTVGRLGPVVAWGADGSVRLSKAGLRARAAALAAAAATLG